MEVSNMKVEENSINIDRYRVISKTYLDLRQYKTALFWADKVLTLSKGDVNDAYALAQVMYLSKQYHRASHLIKSKEVYVKNVQCCYLAATCLSEAKEYMEAMELLYSISSNASEDKNNSASYMTFNNSIIKDSVVTGGNPLEASIHLKRGQVYEAVDNRELATECYKEALFADVHCFEAFEALIQHHMIPLNEETQLLNSLPLNEHCPTETDRDLVYILYECKINKYQTNKLSNIAIHPQLVANLDFIVAQAERYYYQCNYSSCWKLTQEVMSIDPYHTSCLPVHISCLVELKNSNELFLLAHKLVKIYPEDSISWFTVGCYYYVIGKSDPARRYLSKATSLDKLFGPAWLAYGHSFAAESEHDQAMAAYFKASQLMKGCHLPLLYIGLENGLTNNTELAEKFFQQAQAIAPSDPFVSHEMGVIAFQTKEYEKARKHFEEALERIKTNDKNNMLQVKWEPVLNNLGHVYRKLQMYERAIECHLQAMVLTPENPSTYAALGYCQVLIGETNKSVESFHKALSLKRDDTFSTTMLGCVLTQMIDENLAIDSDIPEDVYDFKGFDASYSKDYSISVREASSPTNVDMIEEDLQESQSVSSSFKTP